jgi:hypothetical protein
MPGLLPMIRVCPADCELDKPVCGCGLDGVVEHMHQRRLKLVTIGVKIRQGDTQISSEPNSGAV